MSRNRSSSSNYGQRSSYGQGGSGNYGYGSDNYDSGNYGYGGGNYGMGSSSRPLPLMNLGSGMSRERFDEDYSLGPSNSDYKTPEQIAFDTEFKKWEDSFEEWKLNNRNHPNMEQYRYYERKFLEVRDKLIEKRKEIYGGRQSGGSSNQFDSQLSAADAMAKSILSKYGDSGPRMDSSSGMRNYGNDGGRYNNYGGNQVGYSGPPGNDIISEIARLGSNPQSRWILSALTSALGAPQMNQMNQRPQPQPLFPRGIPRMNSRRNDSMRSGGPRDGLRKKKNKSARMRSRERRGVEVKDKKPAKKTEEKSGEAGESLYDKLDKLLEDARNAECPKLFSGAASKRLKKIKKKDQSTLNENDKKILSLYELVSSKRSAYFAAKEKRDAEKMEEDSKTEQKEEENKVETPENADDKKEDPVEKMEDEPMKE